MKRFILPAVLLLGGIALLIFFPHKTPLVYATGALHAMVLTTTIGRWIVEEREKRFVNWMQQVGDAATAMRATEGGSSQGEGAEGKKLE